MEPWLRENEVRHELKRLAAVASLDDIGLWVRSCPPHSSRPDGGNPASWVTKARELSVPLRRILEERSGKTPAMHALIDLGWLMPRLFIGEAISPRFLVVLTPDFDFMDTHAEFAKAARVAMGRTDGSDTAANLVDLGVLVATLRALHKEKGFGVETGIIRAFDGSDMQPEVQVLAALTHAWRLGLAHAAYRLRDLRAAGLLAREVLWAWEHCLAPNTLRTVFSQASREICQVGTDACQKRSYPPEDWVPGALRDLLKLAETFGNRPLQKAVQSEATTVLEYFRDRCLFFNDLPALEAAIDGTPAPGTDAGPLLVTLAGPVSTKNAAAKTFAAISGPLPVCRAQIAEIRTARATLSTEFPWLANLTRRLFDEIEGAVWGGLPFVRWSPILLVSRPGVGKTRYLRRLSELLGTPSMTLGLAGMHSAMALKGSSAGWADARPSCFIEQLVWQQTGSLFVLLDEIDKASTANHNGNPLDVLLSVLERENARRFHDDLLGVPVDLSYLSFIATANSTAHLPGPLLSRFRLVEVGEPTAKDLEAVVLGTRDDHAKELGVDPRMLPLGLDEVEALAQTGGSARRVSRLTVDYLLRRSLEHVGAAMRH